MPRDDQVYDALMSLASGSDAIRGNLRSQFTMVGQVVAHELAVEYPSISPQAAAEFSYLFVSLMYGHWKMVSTLGLSAEHSKVSRQAVDRLIRSYTQETVFKPSDIVIWR